VGKIIKDTIHAKGINIGIYTTNFENEFISLTDIAKYRNEDDPRFAIQNWMRNRNTIEFLGVWEELHNPNFNRVQYPSMLVKLICLMLFYLGRRLNNGEMKILMKRGTCVILQQSINQLLVLANLESYNAVLITQSKSQEERMQLLRQLVVQQLQTLESLKTNNLPKPELE